MGELCNLGHDGQGTKRGRVQNIGTHRRTKQWVCFLHCKMEFSAGMDLGNTVLELFSLTLDSHGLFFDCVMNDFQTGSCL